MSGSGVRSIALLQVFDRSGDLVFEGRDLAPGDPASGWDGSHNGEPMHAGVYLWYAELLFTDGRVETQHGDVTLLR